MAALLICYLTVIYFSSAWALPVDVARNRPVDAQITCGALGLETFVSQKWQWSGGDVRENHTEICYDATTHPPSAMVDGDDSTFWQSTARPNFNQAPQGPEIFITLDMQQVFEVQTIRLLMGESLRPRRIVIYKSSVDPTLVQPWIYRVQTDQNCTRLYNTPSGTTNVVSIDSKLCQVYLTGPQPLNELLTFDLTPITVPNWRFARYLRIEFYDIDLTLGIVGIPFQHYTVRTMTVMAECTCNGQQIDCSQSNITGTFECVCGNNTQGVNCETCLPFFNQYAYQSSTICQPCNCYNHANTCIFDQNVANSLGSLNAAGIRSGGGVCQNCQNNTAGVNCERCIPLYYRPVSVLQTSASPCVPCNCSGPGMQVIGLVGECVMNAETTTNGMMPGDCRCKTNVIGSQCDRCRDGSYNMSPTNPDGCQSCNCNTNGTIGLSVTCDATGQCVCKRFVMNLQCDTCQDGYYGLDATKLDGCTKCNCDVGGSLPSGCSKDVGACTCRPGVTGQNCDTPASGYYYPDLHFIFGDFENLRAPWDTAQQGYLGFGYVTMAPQRPVSTTVTPPYMSTFSNQFQMVIRYSASAAGSGTISMAGLDGITTATLNMTFPACPPPQWCYAPLGILSLPQGFGSTISVTVLGTSDPLLLLDRLIAIPVEYLNTTNLFGVTDDATFRATCNVISNGVDAASTYCRPKVFSLSTYYLNGALPCNCNFLGSYSNGTCPPYAGQCSCKPGTTGRQCDTCQIQFYGMTDQGCQPCPCNQTAFKACDTFGQCLCPPGVAGATCDHCMDAYYHYDYSRGCTPCDCNNIGALTLTCNATTGVCTCRLGVIGSRCDQCADGFWQMSYAGCLPCSCDVDGSVGTVCDKISGQCPCKKNIQSQQCTSCTLNSFSKSVNHVDGCLSCVCMGVTNICSSAFTVNAGTISPPLFNASQAPLISLVTTSLTPIPIAITPQVIDSTQMAEALVQGSQGAYWQAPLLTGDLLNYYEAQINFVAHWVSSDPGAVALSSIRLMLIGRNRVQVPFAMSVPNVQKNTMTSITVVLSLESAIAAGQPSFTRGQLLVALSQVQAVLIPATFSTPTHASRIGNLTYTLTPASVEQCYCPVGYEGLSCQNCSSGYMRTNVSSQGYLGTCIPCSCNSHSQLCLPDTGECINCLDNTAGFNCELCAVGYYRDSSLGPTSPCNQCPCFMPRVTNTSCALANSSVTCLQCNPGYTGVFCDSCLPFYYGSPMILYSGTCSPCTCNGNSLTCDSVTGQCLNCLNFTDGFNCEKCMDGWFGNASSHICSSCNCNMDGSLSSICNNQTGQCACVDGVGGRMCDACLPNYYRPSSPPDPFFRGCLPCNCNSFGSANLSCGTDGTCPCKPNTIGVKCDQCQVGNWGLPDQTCQACNCDTRGANASFLTSCEIHGGQCVCYPGVGSRRCDACLPMYVNLTAGVGCTACGVCETSLGNDTMQLLTKFQSYWNQTLTFQLIQQQDSALGILEIGIRNAMTQTGLASGYDLVTNLTNLIQQLQQTATASQTNVSNLNNHILTTAASAAQFLNDSTTEYNRVSDIKRQADTVRVDTGTQYINVQNYLQTLRSYNASANQLLQSLAGRPTDGTWNWTGLFSAEYQQTQDELQRAQLTLSAVQQFNASVSVQSNTAVGFQTTLQSVSSSFTSLNNAIATLNANILSFTIRMNQVILSNNQTLTNKKAADDLWAAAQATIAATNAILTQGQTSLAAAQQMVTDCQTIINGVTPGQPLPINTTTDLTGITGWTQAYNLVLQQLQALTVTLNNYTGLVGQTEIKANSLSQQARSIALMFQGVQSKGQPAVDAINGFEQVVQLLNQALQMALDANNTMQRTLSQLQSISVSSIEASANQSLAASQAIKQSIDLLVANVSTFVLNSQLDQANITLQNAIQKWAAIDVRIAAFNAALTSLENVASNVSISADLNAGNAACDAALQRLSDVSNQNNQLQITVASQTAAVTALAADASNMTTLQLQLRSNLGAFQTQENNALAAVTSINASEREILSLQPDLTQRFTDLLTKLTLVQSKMAALEQPVSFSGTTFVTITNPDAGVSRRYNSIGLDFIPSWLKGVLFFAENDQTREKLLIQLVNSSVVFEYSNVDVTNTAVSPASIEVGVWYRVYATRYEFDGQLTVIRMATGGTAVTPMRTVSTLNTQLILNSPLYFGGLLRTTNNLPKVYDSGIPFSGCIYNVVFNGAPVPLWQSILSKDSTATCCRKPAPIPSASTISPCVTFYGFGFIKYQPRSTFSVVTQAQVALQFRTFGPDGVILMFSSLSTTDYYAIYLMGGTVVFAVSASGNVVSVQTVNQYNDGQWYQLKTTHSPSNMQLVVTRMNQTLPSSPEVVSVASAFNLASLANVGFTIGGQNPDVSRGPVSTGFSGCLQDFQHSNALTISFDLSPDSLTTGVNSSAAVDLTKCYASVISGLGFLSTSSYASLRSIPNPIGTMSFQLVTSVQSGVLFYTQLMAQSATGSFFYISLYNGDIFIVFNQGQGTEPSVFRSRGIYLGDGMVHTIALDFTFTNSPRMKIDASETHVGAVTMTPYFVLYDNSLYVGGVPPAVGIDSIFCPVRISLVGGIRNLQINSGAINFFNLNYLTGNNVQGTFLSGLPTPPSVLPPLPYTTLSPPATTLPPSCLMPAAFSFLNSSFLSFTGNTESYVAYNIASLTSILQNAFSIRLSFRALQANGILLYIPGASATPAYYFTIYLYAGRLRASIVTNTSSIQTINLQSLFAYNDGNWHEVEVLRVNDFLAVIIADNKDYINNQVSSIPPSQILFGPTMYLGGVPRSLPGGYPFDTNNIVVGMKSFQGCISNVTIIQYNLMTTMLSSAQEQTRLNVLPCQGKITSGMYLNSSVGYVRVADSVNVAPIFNLVTGFSLNLTFRSSTQSGTLMIAWTSSSRFVALVLSLGQVQVLMNSEGQNIFSGTSRAMPSALTVCNGQPHSVVFTIGNNFVTLQIDGFAAETIPFGAFQYSAPLSVPIYLGGIKDASWNVPGIFAGNTFQGCLQSITVNAVNYFITESPDVLSALSGCPT